MTTTITTIITIVILFSSLTTLAQDHGSPYIPPSIITFSDEPTSTPPPILAPKPSDALQFTLPTSEITSLPNTIPTDDPPPLLGPAQIPAAASPLPKFDPTTSSIFMCTNSDFGGQCQTFTEPVSWCHNLPEGYQKQVSSVKLDEGQTCLVFDSLDCFGGDDWLRYPGSKNLRGRRFDNVIVSWKCYLDGMDGW